MPLYQPRGSPPGSAGPPAYHAAVDWARLTREYPAGEFLATYQGMSVDRLRALQADRFARVLRTAWATPFYRRLWGAAGAEPGDLRDLADLAQLPVVDKTALMADVEEHPPWGTLGVRTDRPAGPRVFQTTSGTTGTPQPVLWGAWGREVQNALLGRVYGWLGVGGNDVVHSVYGHGLVNGGHYVREAVVRYTNALLLSAGTGAETRSERQVRVMAQFGVTVLVGFADYLRHLADVARAAGLNPGHDIPVRMIVGHLPVGARGPVEEAWGGAQAYDWYGVADTGVLAAEGPERDGQWLWEDANVVELLDPDTGVPAADGAEGDLVVTSLGKDDLAPLVRFNTHDLTRLLPGTGPVDLPFRRIAGLLGRSDQMVKVRGINVYPTAVARLLTGVPGATGEYYCRFERRAGGSDGLVVVVETAGAVDPAPIADQLSAALGVRVTAEVVPPGSTAEVTGVRVRQKPVRFVDRRDG